MPFRPDFWSMRFGCLERTLDLLRVLHIASRTVSIECLCSCAVSLYSILLIKYAISWNRAPFLVCRDMKQTRLYCTWAMLLFWIGSACVCYFGHFYLTSRYSCLGGGTVTQQKVDEAGLWNDCTFSLDKIISRFDISRK